MKRAWHRSKVPIIGLVGIVMITIIAFAAVNPDALIVERPASSITGNVVIDDGLFDAKIDTRNACANVDDPVCGTDSTTYQNLCKARKAGVDMRHRGPCGEWVAE